MKKYNTDLLYLRKHTWIYAYVGAYIEHTHLHNDSTLHRNFNYVFCTPPRWPQGINKYLVFYVWPFVLRFSNTDYSSHVKWCRDEKNVKTHESQAMLELCTSDNHFFTKIWSICRLLRAFFFFLIQDYFIPGKEQSYSSARGYLR